MGWRTHFFFVALIKIEMKPSSKVSK